MTNGRFILEDRHEEALWEQACIAFIPASRTEDEAASRADRVVELRRHRLPTFEEEAALQEAAIRRNLSPISALDPGPRRGVVMDPDGLVVKEGADNVDLWNDAEQERMKIYIAEHPMVSGWSWEYRLHDYIVPDERGLWFLEAYEDDGDGQCLYDGIDNLKQEGVFDSRIAGMVEQANAPTLVRIEKMWNDARARVDNGEPDFLAVRGHEKIGIDYLARLKIDAIAAAERWHPLPAPWFWHARTYSLNVPDAPTVVLLLAQHYDPNRALPIYVSNEMDVTSESPACRALFGDVWLLVERANAIAINTIRDARERLVAAPHGGTGERGQESP